MCVEKTFYLDPNEQSLIHRINEAVAKFKAETKIDALSVTIPLSEYDTLHPTKRTIFCVDYVHGSMNLPGAGWVKVTN